MDADEIRVLDDRERKELLEELEQELMHERGVAAMGGAPPNPGRIRHLRRDIARIKTVETEEALERRSSR